MSTNKIEYPSDGVTVWVTYEKEFSFGVYGERKEKHIVTRRGFYSKLFDDVSVPLDWQNFTFSDGEICLLPHGWGGDRLKLNQIINWKYDKN